MSGQFPVFLGLTSTKQRIKCFAQGQNTVTQLAVSLELATLRSLVNPLPTELSCGATVLCSRERHYILCLVIYHPRIHPDITEKMLTGT